MGMHWTGKGKWLLHDARERRSRRRGSRLRRWHWEVTHQPWGAFAVLGAVIIIAGSLMAGVFWLAGSFGWHMGG